MKKAALFSFLFLFTLGMTTGIVVSLGENAYAGEQCYFECLYKNYCSLDTGPECSAPFPYYVYRVDACMGGPLNCPQYQVLIGCWTGSGTCRPIPIED